MRSSLLAWAIAPVLVVFGPAAWSASPEATPQQRLINSYCVECHNSEDWAGSLSFDSLDTATIGSDPAAWEKVLGKLRGAYMPPVGNPRPADADYDTMVAWLEQQLDAHANTVPYPGRPGLYRLNRTEYAAVIRDVLGLEVAVADVLPPDNASYGFDNIASVLGLSSTLLEGYLTAADRVSALAVGDPGFAAEAADYPVSNSLSQDIHLEGLPLGTRGGTRIEHYFPLDAVYEINTRFLGNSVDAIRGLQFPHQFEVALDGKRLKLVTIGGVADYNLMMENSAASKLAIEQRTQVVVPVTAGTHALTVTFVEKTGAQELGQLQPYERINFDPVYLGGIPSVANVSIRGPFKGQAPAGTTASRSKIFTCSPTTVAEETQCANDILARLAHQAWRRPLTDADMSLLMDFFRQGRETRGSFEAGIQLGLRRLLMSPDFLFRLEQDPVGLTPGTSFALNDLELASRLSFFLWSSVPDAELLALAERGALANPRTLEQQVRRMLADPKAVALVDNFAGQWLHLRNLASAEPDSRAFPNFDENLRNAFLQETRMFVGSVLQEDRNVMTLLNADYTFLNERLARHYGIAGVTGDEFRRVALTDERRRGLLGQGSILTVTSFAHRTSPVVRGKWILENILGSSVPAPPDDVPALAENAPDAVDVLSLRTRLATHRANPACAVCHDILDPLGYALEPFDGVGTWRTSDEGGEPIDARGQLADGSAVEGPESLRASIVSDPTQFVSAMSTRLLTYALGRGLEYYDMPTVRAIVRNAATEDYRFSALVLGIVNSVPFKMKAVASTTDPTLAVNQQP
jgi:Protein of unknown function (DUF1592)/Protein of unknown function (DUF1588)/Protein of unknown function (DUF1585)/Protein of unknown function (DUF1587)/Protein of unknown function (DUF1595)/Cytochrome C oxidase, cbb3-type, subunit III